MQRTVPACVSATGRRDWAAMPTPLQEAVDAGDAALAQSFEELNDDQKATLLRVALGAVRDEVLGPVITALSRDATRRLVRAALDRADEALLRAAVVHLDGEDTRKTFAAVAGGLRTAKPNETVDEARERAGNAVAALDADTRGSLLAALGPLPLLNAATTAMREHTQPDVQRLGREANDVLRRLRSELA